MGRELRRVPLDFDWPLKKVWGGYLMPDELRLPTCSACDGECYGPEARAVANTFYAHQIGRNGDALCWSDKMGQAEVDNLVAEERLMDFTHHVERGNGWVANDPPTPPTADQVNEWQRGGGLGHDAINRWIAVKFRCKMLGIVVDCPVCEGNGTVGTPEERKAEEDWRGTPPPEGEGFQLWETTSEGSPISPVFDTIEALCVYAAENCSTFGHDRASAEDWRRMLNEDFVRSEWHGPDGSKYVFI